MLGNLDSWCLVMKMILGKESSRAHLNMAHPRVCVLCGGVSRVTCVMCVCVWCVCICVHVWNVVWHVCDVCIVCMCSLACVMCVCVCVFVVYVSVSRVHVACMCVVFEHCLCVCVCLSCVWLCVLCGAQVCM